MHREPGHGATFKVSLPRVEHAGEPHAAPLAPVGALAGTETILLAEDEAAVRNLGRRVLEKSPARGARGHRMKGSRRRGGSSRQKILVIEDDPVARADLRARLAANGYTVAEAADAASALTVVNRERPDLILLDLGLPAGDGFLVLERLRKIEAFAAIPVLVITGRTDPDTRKRVEAMGVAPLLTKPVTTEVLLTAIRSAVDTEPA